MTEPMGTIFTVCGSDKEFHHYGKHYDEILAKLPEECSILEIGVLNGDSLKAWRMAKPKAEIWGIDINPCQTPEHFIQCDIKTKPTLPIQFDLIVDDGSHKLSDISFVIENYIKQLKPEGVMTIEDVRYPSWVPALREVLHDANWPLPARALRHITVGANYDDHLLIIE